MKLKTVDPAHAACTCYHPRCRARRGVTDRKPPTLHTGWPFMQWALWETLEAAA